MDRSKAFGKVIRAFRKRIGRDFTQGDLAERVGDVQGLSQSDISKIENGRHQSPEMHLAALARGLGVTPAEITHAVDSMLEGSEVAFSPPVLPGFSTVPLIGWVQAGQWDQVVNPFDPEVAESYVHTMSRVSKRAFALRVTGDSMTNPRGVWPSFPEGSTIIVDPQRHADSGSLVIAQVDDDNEATFKKLVREGGRTYLLPLNPQFAAIPVEREIRIAGVVVTMVERPISDS